MFSYLIRLGRSAFGERRQTARQRLGERGERVAVRYLEALGYRIVARNVYVALDATDVRRAVLAEIDVVAYDGDALVFAEVKTRTRPGRVAVERAVGRRKQALLVRAARRYKRRMGVSGERSRFDVLVVIAAPGDAPRVTHLRGYFGAPAAVRARARYDPSR